ncbi:MAG: HlyD family efflux transporter periplasmic adaptor subunit [Chloroflexi bacterium]|nr:HlyD family efflux transporter periplasmic adaptor subunit [Chloroflexota bacterium]
MKRLFIGIGIIAIAIILGAGYFGARTAQSESAPPVQAPATVPATVGDVKLTVTAPGQVVGTQERVLSMNVTGQLAEIKVRPGDTVKVGDILAQLDTKSLQSALEVAGIKLAQAQADKQHKLAETQLDLQIAQLRLDQAKARLPGIGAAQAGLQSATVKLAGTKAGASSEDIAISQHQLEQAKNALWAAQSQRDSICGNQSAPQANCHNANATVNQAEEGVYIAELRLQQLQAGPREDDVKIATAQVQQAQAAYDSAVAEQGASGKDITAQEASLEKIRLSLAQLQAGVDPLLQRDVKAAEENLKAATLTASFAGVVVDVMAKAGTSVPAGAGILLLANAKALEIRSTVIEEDLTLVAIGQEVEIYFDAVPQDAVRGRVARIVPSRIPGDRPLYPVYITLDEVPRKILAGMTADGSIIISQKQNVLRLPRALVRAAPGGTAQVQVWLRDHIEKRSVKLGLRGDVYIEILDGLQAGDQVVGQ